MGTASSRYRAALWLPVRGVSGLTRNACNALTVFQVRQVKTLELNESQATRPTLVQLQSEPGGHHGACFWKHCPGNAASVTPGSGRHMTHGRECVCYKPQGSEGISHSTSHNRGWRQGQEAFSTFALHIPFSIIQLCGLLFTTDLSLLDIWQLAMCSAPWHVCKKGPKNRAKQRGRKLPRSKPLLIGTVLSGAVTWRSALEATGREWWSSFEREPETFLDSDQFSFLGFGKSSSRWESIKLK